MPYKNSGHLHVGHPLLTHNIFTFESGERGDWGRLGETRGGETRGETRGDWGRPQSPLVFFPLFRPLFRSLYFSLARHYLNAWKSPRFFPALSPALSLALFFARAPLSERLEQAREILKISLKFPKMASIFNWRSKGL